MLLDKLIALMFNVFIDIEEKHDWESYMGRPSIALVYYLFNTHHAIVILDKVCCRAYKRCYLLFVHYCRYKIVFVFSVWYKW